MRSSDESAPSPVKNQPEDPPRLLADVMLGSLAKWLRILGFDTAYDNQISDDRIVLRCVQEDRIALTRDTRLVQRRLLRKRHLLIRSEAIAEQVSEVLEFLDCSPESIRLLSRCLECNSELVTVSPAEIAGEVPPYVKQTQDDFKRCPSCKKVFWRGTHREHILRRLLRLARLPSM